METGEAKGKGKQFLPLRCSLRIISDLMEAGAVIGDDIYWAGRWRREQGKITVSKDLLKHNIHHDGPTSWEKVSSLTIPLATPFLAAVGRKLAVVAGTDYRFKPRNYDDDYDDDDDDDDHMVDDNWRKCGEIYDLDNQTWDYLSSDIQLFDPYNVYHITTVVEDPTQVVFYCLGRGSMLILDASTGSKVEDGNHDSYFALYREISPQDHLPPCLEVCESIVPLNIAVGNSPAVFHKRTFYWFTFELRLYGYDMGLRR